MWLTATVTEEEKNTLQLLDGEDDWRDEGLEEPQDAAEDSKKDRRRRELLQRAAADYGTDFVRKLDQIRDAKERIVFVAESVFARKGFGGARTREIADLAAVNKAMIHYYFDSKEKLFHAVLDKILFDLIKLTQETVRDELPPARQLETFFRGFFDYVASHRNFSRLTTMEVGSSDRYLARLVETFFKPLFDRGVKFIERGVEAKVFQKVNARQFLVSIYTMTIGYFSDREFVGMMFGEDPLSEKILKERREAILDFVFAGLGCKRP